MNFYGCSHSSAPASPVLRPNRDASDKLLRVSSKKKLLISPSKDLMVFFGNQAFNKFNTIKKDQTQHKHTKLTLERKSIHNDKNSHSKLHPSMETRQSKTPSFSNSTEFFHEKKDNTSNDGQRLQKIKKEVDQIRRKYSYNKLGQRSFYKSVDHSQSIRVSTENSSQVSNQSMRNSKEKHPCLTPKNDRYLGKRILTKNVFGQHSGLKLNLTNSKLTKTLKMNKKQSQQMRRKGSFEFFNSKQPLNLSSQINQTTQKSLFQFTFGSMAMMDFQNKQQLKGNKLKI